MSQVPECPEGFRVLNVGEMIQMGDVYYSSISRSWEPTPCLSGVVAHAVFGFFIRPVISSNLPNDSSLTAMV